MIDIFNHMNRPTIMQSDLVPKAETRIARKEWVERYVKDGKVKFRIHPELRQHGSEYKTIEIPERAYLFNWDGRQFAVMSPDAAASIMTSNVV